MLSPSNLGTFLVRNAQSNTLCLWIRGDEEGQKSIYQELVRRNLSECRAMTQGISRDYQRASAYLSSLRMDVEILLGFAQRESAPKRRTVQRDKYKVRS